MSLPDFSDLQSDSPDFIRLLADLRARNAMNKIDKLLAGYPPEIIEAAKQGLRKKGK